MPSQNRYSLSTLGRKRYVQGNRNDGGASTRWQSASATTSNYRSSTSISSTSTPTPRRQQVAGRPSTRFSRGRVQSTSSSRQYSINAHQFQQPARPSTTLNSLDNDRNQYDDDDDDEEDFLNEVVMAIEVRERGTIGCAYYVASTETLFFMDDIKSGDKDTVETLKLQISPTVVLVCSRVEDDILECLTVGPGNSDDEISSNGIDQSFLLELRPRSEFDYHSATSKLVELNIGAQNGPRVTVTVPGDIPGDDHPRAIDPENVFTPQAALMKLSGWVQMDSRVTVGCAGAIISYIQRRRLARFLPGDSAARDLFRLSTIELFSLRGTVYINLDTVLSLQILQSELHPHQHRQGPTATGSKEGLSLYRLFAPLARTPQGKHRLKQYFLRPSYSQQVLRDRLDAVSLFTLPENGESVRGMINSMKGVKNVRRLLFRLRAGVSGGTGKSGGIARSIWSGLRDFSGHVLSTFYHFRNIVSIQHLPLYVRFELNCNTEDLTTVGSLINNLVDFDVSATESRTCVKPGVDQDLDERKRFYNGVSDLLSQVAQEVMKRIPENVPTELNVIYFPQIGFLIAMQLDSVTGRSLWEGSEDDQWERMFSTENVVYYKNDQMKEMDERFGDLYGDICDLEIEMVHELAESILQYEELLAKMSDLCGELDCLLAYGQAAEQFRLVRPTINDDNIIHVKAGRHLLQECSTPAFVPNDTVIVGRRDADCIPRSMEQDAGANAVIITGPNYSGKSVYMKQVALIVYMAHIGSFVPAESAEIGLTDKILTRISTRESVSRSQSAFKIDLDQICRALKLCTRRSLLIIDEFGKGTNSSDGAGLACATIEHFLRPDIEAPKALIATHFHEIFDNGYIYTQPGIDFLHMEVRIDEEASEAADQVVHVYNLRQGRSRASYGTVCAAINGIPPNIIDRAEQLVLLCARGEDLSVACALVPEDEAENLQSSENIARIFLASNLEDPPRQLVDDLLRG